MLRASRGRVQTIWTAAVQPRLCVCTCAPPRGVVHASACGAVARKRGPVHSFLALCEATSHRSPPRSLIWPSSWHICSPLRVIVCCDGPSFRLLLRPMPNAYLCRRNLVACLRQHMSTLIAHSKGACTVGMPCPHGKLGSASSKLSDTDVIHVQIITSEHPRLEERV